LKLRAVTTPRFSDSVVSFTVEFMAGFVSCLAIRRSVGQAPNVQAVCPFLLWRVMCRS
jgi:hypothetical protein